MQSDALYIALLALVKPLKSSMAFDTHYLRTSNIFGKCLPAICVSYLSTLLSLVLHFFFINLFTYSFSSKIQVLRPRTQTLTKPFPFSSDEREDPWISIYPGATNTTGLGIPSSTCLPDKTAQIGKQDTHSHVLESGTAHFGCWGSTLKPSSIYATHMGEP